MRSYLIACCMVVCTTVAGIASDNSNKFVEVGKKSLPAMVVIRGTPAQGFLEYYLSIDPVIKQKSGFLISSNGYIVTSSGAVKDAKTIMVTLYDGQAFPARFINQNNFLDIVILKIEGSGLPYLPFGNSDAVEIGEWVVALGVYGTKEPSLDAVLISNKNKRATQGTNLKDLEFFMEIDRITHGGQPNEPILNLNNEVVAVTTHFNSWIKVYKASVPPISVAYIAASNYIKPLIDSLIKAAQENDPSLEAPKY